jgi:dTDP-4-dehydrorhamnose 3,5-epimerase
MISRFDMLDTPLEGLKLVQRKPISDHRGYFERIYCAEELGSITSAKVIAQVNRTVTELKGTVRGMHFQYPPYSEIKIVSCTQGEIFDVAVDVRQGSPTFLRWHGEVLSGDNHRALVIPEGFAHGFQTMTDKCEMHYLHTRPYSPGSEGGLNPCDSMLAIRWPCGIVDMSDRDRSHKSLTSDFTGISL